MKKEIIEFDDSPESKENPLAEIIEIKQVIKHPDADALDLISPDGSSVNWAVEKLGKYKVGDKAVWIDSVNDPLLPVKNPAFAFLAKGTREYVRLKPKRLRGIFSRGILVDIPEDYDPAGELTIAATLGIKKASERSLSGKFGKVIVGQSVRGPNYLLESAAYDVSAIFKFTKNLKEGDKVYITEKIHGCNAAYGWLTFEDKLSFWVRSKRLWKDQTKTCSWVEAAKTENLAEKLKGHPEFLFYGEIYGSVQDLAYGIPDATKFVLFDIWNIKEKCWLPFEDVIRIGAQLDIKVVPIPEVYTWPAKWVGNVIPDEIKALAEGKTLLSGDCIREGIVIRSDGYTEELGIKIHNRFCHKLVGNGYLERK